MSCPGLLPRPSLQILKLANLGWKTCVVLCVYTQHSDDKSRLSGFVACMLLLLHQLDMLLGHEIDDQNMNRAAAAAEAAEREESRERQNG